MEYDETHYNLYYIDGQFTIGCMGTFNYSMTNRQKKCIRKIVDLVKKQMVIRKKSIELCKILNKVRVELSNYM